MNSSLKMAVLLAGIIIVSIVGSSFVYHLGYQSGYQSGNQYGNKNGFDQGYGLGYGNGYDLGYEHGNSSGYQKAINDTVPVINQTDYFSHLVDAYHYNVSCGGFKMATIYLRNGETNFEYFRVDNTWDCKLTVIPSEYIFVIFYMDVHFARMHYTHFYHLVQLANGSIIQTDTMIYTLHMEAMI